MAKGIQPVRILSSSEPSCRTQHVPVLRLSAPAHDEKENESPDSFETRPCFASSWLVGTSAECSDFIERYAVEGVTVSISAPRDSSCGEYSIDPPEYRLNPLHTQSLANAIEQILTRPPADVATDDLATIRSFIKAQAKNHIYTYLSAKKTCDLAGGSLDREAEALSEMLVKYTAGYGLMETLLLDEKVQDIYIDAPSSETPVRVLLRSDTDSRVRQKCRTNVLVGRRDLQGFVSRVKLETGLPFSEAFPVLEADIKRLRARVTLVGPPLSDKGISIAVRKHSDRVWSLPRLIRSQCLSPLLAGFLWSSVLGRRSILVAGSRGAGKTTLLGAMVLEFPLSQRIVLIEDTPEIPVARLQALGYDVQALRFSGTSDDTCSAESALRVSLRMGESAIVVGEVRGSEAKVLYESMRAGSAGSSVLGTIHANSARGVLDRAVEDLGVSERAFSSTDLIVVIDLMRSPDGTRFDRRIAEVVEVRPKGHEVELVPLFQTEEGCRCAKPTSQFSSDCRTIERSASALGTKSAALLDIVKAKAHADQIVSERDDPKFWSDEFRTGSNEFLTRRLFDTEGPEKGLCAWKGWLNG